MSVISSPALFMGEDGYQISRSVRLRSSAFAYFSRTPASATNRKTWTWSGWVKRGKLGAEQFIFSCYAGSSDANEFQIEFTSSDTLSVGAYTTTFAVTNQVFRDPSAWYHIVFAFDTTQATSTNRWKLYVNGTQVTSFSTANYPTQNTDWSINSANEHRIGYFTSSLFYYDGYFTEINFIDGQQLTASSFGENDSITGVWKPKKYAGTYGTNGFYLNFSDNSNNTAATIGKDYSGNGNNWTPNNISVTTGSTYDSMLDTPTPYADGGNGRGNYPTLNPLWYTTSGAGTLSNGNLTFTQSSGVVYGNTYATMAFPSIGTTGKYYFELVFTNGLLSDVNQGGGVHNAANTSDYAIVQPKSGSTVFNRSGTTTSSATGYAFNDVLQVAVDTGAGKIWFGKNNTWYSGDPAAGTSPTYSDLASGASYVPGFTSYSNSVTGQVNFGQRPFAYTPPTGFKALNTQNLPTPTIGNGANYMAATTYTGNGGTQSIANTVNGVSFKPDLVWVKGRSVAYNNYLEDSVRGVGKDLSSNLTDAEATYNLLSSFNSNGFTVFTNGTYLASNQNGTTYVAWQWQAGQGTTSSNTSGSITSTVSVNATAGFSVVTYTGNFTAGATIGHGLGIAPSMILVFRRSTGGNDHSVYHTSVGATKSLFLNSTAGTNTDAGYWNNTAPTSSVITLGQSNYTNPSSGTMVTYCWAEVAGFSKFGSYTGNGSADGSFVYCGFKPRWLMVKRSSTGGTDWYILDTSRSTYNQSQLILQADLSNAESDNSTLAFDLLSNGFKARTTGTAVNQSGETYIYAAFAENPFKNALAR